EKVVVPALQAQGITRLDKLMLTHLDNDHSGGAPSVLQHIPVIQLSSSEVFGSYPTHLCEAGERWQWDGVIFTVLAPLPQHHQQIPSDKNESSCVLMVQTPATQTVPSQHVLIMGDAGFYTEFLLLQQSGLSQNLQKNLDADLLIVGHHGSKHSSS
ncbi:MBL fold metallo-hydrolase, partial [Rhizobium hidalgonense]